MHGQRCVVLLGSLIFICLAPLACAEPALLRAVDALDEPRGYCIDIPGSGPTINLDAPLQGHTCKFRDAITDQLFDAAAGQHIRASEYERCLAVEALEPKQPLLLRACTDSRLQRWQLTNGRLSPAARPELCVALGA